MSDYGKKGGTSATAGQKAATYEVVLPDGSRACKRTFQIDAPEALAACFQNGGRWSIAGIHAERPSWARDGIVMVLATRCDGDA